MKIVLIYFEINFNIIFKRIKNNNNFFFNFIFIRYLVINNNLKIYSNL